MQRWRVPPAIALLASLFAARVSDGADATSKLDITNSFEAQIAQLDARDPRAPQALEAHLRYAAYLSNEPGEACSARLAAARSQLQAAQKNAALGVVVPQGLARAAAVEYQLHTALASCGDNTDALRRDQELRAALESAQRAAALYEETFDYPAMITMQFNAAVTEHNLGDTAAAQSALRAVIDTDRKYGFRDDAEENYRLLLTWLPAAATAPIDPQQQASPDRQVAALMQDFPQRSTTLYFAWVPGNRTITLISQSARLSGDKVVNATGSRTVMLDARKRSFGWLVTYQPLDSHYSLEPLSAGTGVESSFLTSLGTMLLHFHDFSLRSTKSETGGMSADFDETVDARRFKERVEQEAHAYQQANLQFGAAAPAGAGSAAIARALDIRLKSLLWPVAVDANSALDYNLETGAWPGATLEQGQWYGMKLMLPLPFAPNNFVLHQVQFAFTRELPCSQDSDRTCVELVLRAVPDETDFMYAMRRLQHPMRLHQGETLHASSTMYMRLITDPSTLQAYHRDLRQFFYVWVDGAANDAALEPLLGSDRTAYDLSPVNPLTD